MRSKQPEIFDYLDFRRFLADVYETRKVSRGFSYRAFSKVSGFNSPNFMKLVIDGARNLSPQATIQVADGLKLHGPALEYFKVLVAMNQSQDDSERVDLLARLQTLMPHGRKREIGAEGVQYLSSWLYPVVRDLISAPDFREDPYWISRRLRGRVSADEVRGAIGFLIEHGYIRRNEKGQLETADDVVLSTDEVRSLAVRSYHRSMLGEAIDALASVDVKDREFGALTVAIPVVAIPELKAKIKAFRKDLHTWVMAQRESLREDQSTEIIQLNIQMFPHTGNGKSESRLDGESERDTGTKKVKSGKREVA
jgi:uncharacterized protein (TIGR02147 family)